MSRKRLSNATRNVARLDLSGFEPHRLQSESDTELALANFENQLDDTRVDAFVEDSLSRQFLFEFVFSGISDTASTFLSERVIGRFPVAPESFKSSLASKILSCLSLSFYFLTYPSESDRPGNLEECKRSVDLAPPVLENLASRVFMEEPTAQKEYEDSEGEEDETTLFIRSIRTKQKSQRQSKKAKRSARFVAVDPTPFVNLGVGVPKSQEDADHLSAQLLEDQKGVLEYYFSILRRPTTREAVQKCYIPQEPASILQPNNYTSVVQDETQTVPDRNIEQGRSAYPVVQPMKAALYFDSAEGFGQWHILISTRASKDLREARRSDAKTFRIIIKKIKELSNGHFSDDNQKRLTGPDTEVPVYEAKMTRDLRLVYQVDCVPEYDSEVERQVLRIFGIYTHTQMDDRLWNSVGCQLAVKGKEYRRRCTFRNKPHHVGDNVILPASFAAEHGEIITPTTDTLIPDVRKEDLEELHSLLVLEKFVVFSQAYLNGILADVDVAHVFNVSPEEKQVIEHTGSCYVLGRSGTGKTTTMLFKMLGIERTWTLFPDAAPKPRQIFVTQSRVLATRVEDYFSKLLESLAMSSQSPKELLKSARQKAQRQQQDELIDLDDDVDWRSDLPKKYSLLEDEHFPLFITFDRLCKLLLSDLEQPSAEAVDYNDVPLSPTSPSPMSPKCGGQDVAFAHPSGTSTISYATFLDAYWPRFPQFMTKGLDPSLVFSEFMGVIKGSEQALGFDDGRLDKQAYTTLSHRSQSTFATQRELIYDLFEQYLKHKRRNGHRDVADRSHTILRRLQADGVPGRKIDFLYVDEVQDNILIDASLLRLICKNPDGLFWAGDTAQTISVGSSFRFDDLKAFLYRVEEAFHDLYYRKSIHPCSFQLSVNYRSHGGIVKCARSVVDLITEFWPYTIDQLDKEKGIVDGLKPVFFSGWDKDTVRYEQFLFGETGTRIEFGAQQCILVRDESAREKLRAQVGDIGLIMTLYESKGLEFDDVLLYNFFEDSTVDISQWRVIYNAIPRDQRSKNVAPRFDEVRHAGVCSELKFLYVAITRARKNIWMVDCSERSEPMRNFWHSHNLIQICTPGMDVPQLAVSSTTKEWEESGRKLFQHKRYFQAMHCFRRAGLEREASVAHAFHIRDQARSMRAESEARLGAFIAAAEAFKECADAASTVAQRRHYYRNAGDCFVRGGDDAQAAEAFIHAGEYTQAAQRYRRAGLLEKAVDVVQTYKDSVDGGVASKVVHVARLFYMRGSEIEKATKLFSTYEEGLEFMESYDLDIARATLLEKMSRFTEAAELHLEEGRTIEAIRLFLASGSDVQSIQRAKECLVEGLWKSLSFGVTIYSLDASIASVKKLLLLSEQLNGAALTQKDVDEILMFKAIATMGTRGTSKLRELGVKFALGGNDPASTLLCFDHAFVNPPKIQVANCEETAAVLQMFCIYVRTLRQFALHSDPCGDEVVQKLFGFRILPGNDVHLPAGTFLHQSALERTMALKDINEKGASLAQVDFLMLYRQALIERLRFRVDQENELCLKSRGFSPCIAFSIFGRCNKVACPREHIEAINTDKRLYNMRVRIHLQQMLIFQSLYPLVSWRLWNRNQRIWLSRLHEVLHPPYYMMGSFAMLETALIPEFTAGMQVVRGWLQDLLFSLDPFGPLSMFLTPFAIAATLGFEFDRYRMAMAIRSSPSFHFHRLPPPLTRINGSRYIIEDLVDFIKGDRPWCLSAGILFISHIMDNALPFDADVLCNLLERLCASFVAARLIQKTATLHGLVLPKSWLINLSKNFDKLKSWDTHLIWRLTAPMKRLLQLICSGRPTGEHLVFRGRDVSRLPGQILNVFIARICTCMSLLGYNTRDDGIRAEIVQTLCIVRQNSGGWIYPPICARFIDGKEWRDVASAVRQSMVGTNMDAMVQLHHRDRGAPFRVLPVEVVIFDAIKNIPDLLASRVPARTTRPPLPTASSPAAASILDVNASASPSSTSDEPIAAASSGAEGVRANAVDNPEQKPEDKPEERPEEPHETMEKEVIDRTERTDSISPSQEVTDSESKILSAKREQAANLINSTYRRYRHRLRHVSKSGLTAGRASIFSACMSASKTMQWPDSRYRLLFLGPLPHVLACLDHMRAYAQTSKEKAKQKFKEATHQDLDEASERLTRSIDLLKEISRLQKTLQLGSDLHLRYDLAELRAQVSAVERLMESLPGSLTGQLRSDMDIGLKGIVREKRPPPKLEKPDLQLDDDYKEYTPTGLVV